MADTMSNNGPASADGIDDVMGERHAATQRATEAQRRAAQAYDRLLHLAENKRTGQTRRVAQFLASTYSGQEFPYDLFDLRTFDVDIADDMLACLDALRWGNLHELVPGGESRVRAVLGGWGFHPDLRAAR